MTMTASWTFVVTGTPVPKARARSLANGKHYTPNKTRGYEAHVWCAAQIAGVRQGTFGSGPLAVTLHFWMPKPKRPKDKDLMIVKPDVDNLAKAVLDGLKPGWGDDCQIVRLTAEKAYATMVDGLDPCCVVMVQQL